MKIIFTPLSESAQLLVPHPVPASKVIPEWYKKTPPYIDNNKSTTIIKGTSDINSTIKGCLPFLDAMVSGYMILLSADIEVNIEDGAPLIKWRANDITLIEATQPKTMNNLPRNNMEYDAFKWIFDWKIQTPPGYSCLYTHPFNRMDLSFRTLTGIVDTDVYPDSVHFPAQLLTIKENFIIEKGTPICQVFPFKRDSWKYEIKNYNPDIKKKANFDLFSKIVKSYKNQFWHRKEYK